MIELSLICVALLAFIAYRERQFGFREREWSRERSELISRLQHPEVVVPAGTLVPPQEIDAAAGEALAPEPDEIDLVGTVIGPGTDGNGD